ncbi:MAG: adenylosuccinate lyase [Chloroflexi bacterium]|nr:adenylosuccinate lyase [Chloroflexota bacterium]
MIDRYAREAMKAVWQDQFKFETWLEVELAVCKAWAEHGEIPPEDIPLLERATFDMPHWEEAFKTTRHDVTAFLSSISRDLGSESRHIHKGLTSNDVWDTATALQLRAASNILLEDIDKLEEAITRRAVEHKDTLMMGRTHGVHAEPTTLGLKLALWVEETRRMRQRLEQAARGVSVGKFSGAVGTHATLPPEVEETACRFLGLEVENISSQIVPRDRHAEFVTAIALCAASLEKFATEIRSLQRTEVLELEEPFHAGQTGSSAMPHKRNPELSERICGLARLIRGHAVTALENVALWHERDISHSSAERIILPDATMALDYILDVATYVIGGMRVYEDNMMTNVEKTRGLVFSQRVMLSLIDKGLTRDEAYKITQTASMESWNTGQDFRDLLRQNDAVAQHLPPEELESLFDYTYYTRYVDDSFKRIGLA